MLDAIALLLSSTNTTVLTESDYWNRELDVGFSIEAVMSLPKSSGINQQNKNAWPWEWDGQELRQPSIELAPLFANTAEAVYNLRVRGTAEFELEYEILQPDGSADHLAFAIRRNIGIVRLSGDDRNDRDLRLIQGSALDRLLSDKTLRSRLGQRVGKIDIADELKDLSKEKLTTLDLAFQQEALPSGLNLGIAGGPDRSLNALIGLTAAKDDIQLPLASWGAGTRRLAALQIAAIHQGENPITLVDEVERGLEPYRQRVLMGQLLKGKSQSFVTTHSASALSAATQATLWYLDSKGSIGSLPQSVAGHLRRDPELFLARLAIIVEGATEFGFVRTILEKSIGHDLLVLGIWLSDAGGNDNALILLQGMVGSGLRFGGFVDNEGRDIGKWKLIKNILCSLLHQWAEGSTEANIINFVVDEQLEAFICDPSGERTGDRLRTLADRLGIEEKEFESIRDHAPNLKQLIIDAASGSVPNDSPNMSKEDRKKWKAHSRHWFKSIEGGEELATKVLGSQFNLSSRLEGQLLPFVNAVRAAIRLPEIDSIPHE
jgi:putative ATP-dependent endonuclease of OLD family